MKWNQSIAIPRVIYRIYRTLRRNSDRHTKDGRFQSQDHICRPRPGRSKNRLHILLPQPVKSSARNSTRLHQLSFLCWPFKWLNPRQSMSYTFCGLILCGKGIESRHLVLKTFCVQCTNHACKELKIPSVDVKVVLLANHVMKWLNLVDVL